MYCYPAQVHDLTLSTVPNRLDVPTSQMRTMLSCGMTCGMTVRATLKQALTCLSQAKPLGSPDRADAYQTNLGVIAAPKLELRHSRPNATK